MCATRLNQLDQRACTAVDTPRHHIFLIFAIQLWDLFSDILFAREVYEKWTSSDSPIEYNYIFVGSLGFLCVPWLTNLYHILMNSHKLQKQFEDNPHAILWFRQYRKWVAWLVAISGGIYPSLALCSVAFMPLWLAGGPLSVSRKKTKELIKHSPAFLDSFISILDCLKWNCRFFSYFPPIDIYISLLLLKKL